MPHLISRRAMSYDLKTIVLDTIFGVLREKDIPCHRRQDSVNFGPIGGALNDYFIFYRPGLHSILVVDVDGTAASIKISSPTMMSDMLMHVKRLRCRLPIIHLKILESVLPMYYMEV